MHLLPRAVAVALLGALAGAVCLVGVAAWRPALAFEMDRHLPSYVSGFYQPERAGGVTFAWTGERIELSLAGVDRRVPWTCMVRFRGARPSQEPQPDVVAAVDGTPVRRWRATNEFQDVEIAVPVTPATPGLILSLVTSRLYEPGPSDSRRLGIQVDRLACAPASGVSLPPRHALGAAAASGAILGAGFALTGITAGSAVGAAVLMAVGQAFVLVSGGGMYGPYPSAAVRLALVLAAAAVLLSGALQLGRKPPLRNTARFAVTFSAGALYLQLLALLRPATPLADTLVNAQLSSPAMGLHAFFVPFGPLAPSHPALQLVVVCALGITAGAVLYPLVVRTWGNRLAGAIAVALFSLAPVSYGIIGRGNPASASCQSVSIIAVVALAMQAGRLRRPLVFTGVAALITLGLACDFVNVLLLASTLFVMALLFWRLGGQTHRGVARWVVLVTAIALLAATAMYWGHFEDLYRAIHSSPGVGPNPDRNRLAHAVGQILEGLGWPIVVLALVGAWRLFADGGRNRLDLVVAAWMAVWLVSVTGAALPAANWVVGAAAADFIGRLVHATLPAAVLLAARGAAWGWRAGAVHRVLSIVLLASSVVVGVRAWAGWFQ